MDPTPWRSIVSKLLKLDELKVVKNESICHSLSEKNIQKNALAIYLSNKIRPFGNASVNGWPKALHYFIGYLYCKGYFVQTYLTQETGRRKHSCHTSAPYTIPPTTHTRTHHTSQQKIVSPHKKGKIISIPRDWVLLFSQVAINLRLLPNFSLKDDFVGRDLMI